MTLQEAAQILEIPMNATEKQLIAAYRKLAKRWHPDAHPNDPVAAEMMIRINEAYRVFRKELSRAETQSTPSDNSSRPDYTDHRPGTESGTSSNNNDRDSVPPPPHGNGIMETMLREAWDKYNNADIKYRNFAPELRKAFNEKVAQQERYDKQKSIFDKSPTPENFQILGIIMLDLNRATMEHETAMFKLKSLKLERDLWLKEYKRQLSEYAKIKNRSER